VSSIDSARVSPVHGKPRGKERLQLLMSLGSLTDNRQLKDHFSRGKMPTQRRTTEGKGRTARIEEKEVSHTHTRVLRGKEEEEE